MSQTARAADLSAAPISASSKVLICSVDGGWFGVRADWVEAVCPRESVVEQTLKGSDGTVHRYVMFQNEPALVLELRALVGVDAVVGRARRKQFMLVRSGQWLMAVPVDACVGVRALDLQSQTPVPSRIRRDGGIPIAHIVGLDDRMLVVLDPTRLLDARNRAVWATIVKRAQLFNRRLAKLESTWAEVRAHATTANLRAYASLCSRAGRSRAAAAAREAVGYLPTNDGAAIQVSAPSSSFAAIRALLEASEGRHTGRWRVELEGGGVVAIELSGGRVVDTPQARGVLSQVLTTSCGASNFYDSDGEASDSDGASAASVLVESLEVNLQDQRKRR